MRRRVMGLAVLAAVTVGLLAGAGWGGPANYSMVDLAKESDLVFVGKVVKVEEKTATVEIEKVIAGKYEGKNVVVMPITISTDLPGARVNMKVGEAVLMFTKKGKEGEPVTVVRDGYGKRTLDEATRADDIAMVTRVVEIVALKEEEAINRAMLKEATSANARLRAVACRHVTAEIGYGQSRDKYANECIGLLDSEFPEAQRAGLDGLRYVGVDISRALPRMIELTKSDDKGVADSASMAVGHLRVPEATAALVALTENADPDIRVRAILDLGNNNHEGAKAALAARLDDKEAKVRAIAPTGLVNLLRDGKADDLIVKIAALLKDPDEEVAASAARALGETRSVEAIVPLLEVLGRGKVSRNLQYFTLQSLGSHYTKDGAEGQAVINKRLDLVIAALKADKETGGFGPAFAAVGILEACGRPEATEALKWAAENLPNTEVREYAKRALSKK